MQTTPVKRALLSVSDKSGIVELAKSLIKCDIEIISTGGTSKLLTENKIPHRSVDEITGLPEMLDGRVKTLHPKIHGGILGRRDVHREEAATHHIPWIDLVVVNFYPFSEATKKNKLSWSEAIEYIDIGGPTMVRAAAKNSAWVTVVMDPQDYSLVIDEINQGGVKEDTRRKLALKVFEQTAQYESTIADYLAQLTAPNECPQRLNLNFEKTGELRYGENPHQKACAYRALNDQKGVLSAHQFQGKPLSYNNILDSEAALSCVKEFSEPACVVVKHANPCGAATAETINLAFNRALNADPVSAFGGIIALNQKCTAEIAEAIAKIFMEVIIAPEYDEAALKVFSAKPNLRVLALPMLDQSTWEMKFISGGVLLQERDQQNLESSEMKVVTKNQPTERDMQNMLFAWRVLKHIKSNGILLAKDNATVGVGAGQVSRIDAVDLAIRKGQKNISDSVLASDAFFPFRDSIDRLANTGIKAIIQPGGSMRDEEVIAACNEHGIAMVFTGKRCFKH